MSLALTSDQAARLRETRAADAQGRPLVLHHGTLHSFDKFERTQDLGFHFGTRKQALRRLETLTAAERKAAGSEAKPRVVSVGLATRNPLLLPADPVSWTAGHVATLLRRFLTRGELTEALNNQIDGARRHAVIRSALIRAGYDSIVYRNQIESAVRSRGTEWSWVALDPAIVVPLGEGVAADVAICPSGKPSRPGFDADAKILEMGGLRRRNGQLASIHDMRRFRDAAIAACNALDGECRIENVGFLKAGSNVVGTIGQAHLRVDITGDVGRVRVWIQPADARALEKAGRSAESIKDEFHESREFVDGFADLVGPLDVEISNMISYMMPTATFTSEWAPGEPMEASVDRFSDIFGKMVEVVRSLESCEPAHRF